MLKVLNGREKKQSLKYSIVLFRCVFIRLRMFLLIRAENWHQCDKDYMTQTTKPKLFDLTDLISSVLLVGILVIIGRCLNKKTSRIVIIFNFFITHSRIPGSILKFSKQM